MEPSNKNNGRPLPPIETRWKKGQSGNPKGRPKRKDSLTEGLKDLLKEICPTDPERRRYRDLFLRRVLQQALQGSATAIKEIFNRHDGKVPVVVEVLRLTPIEAPKRKKGFDPDHPMQLSEETMNKIRSVYGLGPVGGGDPVPVDLPEETWREIRRIYDR